MYKLQTTSLAIDVYRIAPDEFLLVAGAYKQYGQVEQNRQHRGATHVIVHENYTDCRFQLFEHDIALIKVDEPFELNDKVKPVCIPNHVQYDSNCIVSGWGLTERTCFSLYLLAYIAFAFICFYYIIYVIRF